MRRIIEGRRRGTLTLLEFGALFAHLRARGHSPRRIARAAGLGCGMRAVFGRH